MSDYEKRFRRLHLVQSFRPVVGATFNLTVDNTVDPMEVLTKQIGQTRGEWRFAGPAVQGIKTYRAELVSLGDGANLAEARARAQLDGYRLIEGQGFLGVMHSFPKPAGYHIYFGGNEWVEHKDSHYLVYLRIGIIPRWEPSLVWSGHPFTSAVLWAVEKLEETEQNSP